MRQPNGWFVNNMIVFGDLDTRGYVSKGFKINTCDSRQSFNMTLNEIHHRLNTFLRTIEHDTRVQFQWGVDSDYQRELLLYRAETEKTAKNEWTKFVREERFNRYWKMMLNRELRRENLYIYITKKIKEHVPNNLTDDELEDFYTDLLKNYELFFNRKFNELQAILSNGSTKVSAMTDEDHFLHWVKFLNPSFSDRDMEFDPLTLFEVDSTIQDNCWFSGFKGNNKRNINNDFAFFMDEYYHDIILIKRMPETTYPGIMHQLTSLPIINYSITVNIYPIQLEVKIDETERLIERLKGDMAAERKASLEASIDKAHDRLYNISSGEKIPFKADVIIRLWASNTEQLINNASIIKSQINLMNGSKYWEIPNCTTAKNLFYMTWPGWTFSEYSDEGYAIEEDDPKLTDMIPFSSTYTGLLENAEALYDGDLYNIIGVKTFKANSPQHSAVFGSTGAGKSATIIDLLSQTECFYDFSCIIEDGLSYGVMTRAYGEAPVIFNPNSTYIINYLDTGGLPITPQHISSASGLVAMMCGHSTDESLMKRRTSIITEHINMLYEDKYNDWKESHQDMIPDIAKTVLAVNKYKTKEMPEGSSFIEAWVEFRDIRNDPESIAREILNSISEDDISKLMVSDEESIKNVAFAWFNNNEYPVHSELYELIRMSSFEFGSDKEIGSIAQQIKDWCYNGKHGCLFDGFTNVRFDRKIVHFELGRLSSADKQLKEIVVFLISNQIRNHIISLPRKCRKRIVFEEAGKLLNIPGGTEIISEAYAQMRKLNTFVLTIVQQYAMFKNDTIRPIIMGNSKQFFILKQLLGSDLDDLSKDITISERAKNIIREYKSPADNESLDKYASFTYHFDSYPVPEYGTVRNICCPEMLYVSSSNAELFDIRSRQLKKEPNLVEAIKRYSRNIAIA